MSKQRRSRSRSRRRIKLYPFKSNPLLLKKLKPRNLHEKNEKVLFVFYTLSASGASWEYPRLPREWKWIGSGSTSSVKYQREEQFQGSTKQLKQTRDYLDQVFKKLKEKNVIKLYKIRNSYLP